MPLWYLHFPCAFKIISTLLLFMTLEIISSKFNVANILPQKLFFFKFIFVFNLKKLEIIINNQLMYILKKGTSNFAFLRNKENAKRRRKSTQWRSCLERRSVFRNKPKLYKHNESSGPEAFLQIEKNA